MLNVLLVDESWTRIGEFQTDPVGWSVGEEFSSEDRRFAIVAIVLNPAPDAEHAATWIVEQA